MSGAAIERVREILATVKPLSRPTAVSINLLRLAPLTPARTQTRR